MAVLSALAELLDPPPLADELASPSSFAEGHSWGQWRRYRHLDMFEHACLDTIDNGRRLILSAAVRHGKTDYVRWLTSWYLATHPNHRVILASHEADFAASHGRFVRDTLTEWGHLFGVKVSPRSEAANRWDFERPHRGGMITVGTGGRPIGRGANLMIIDDPVGSYEDAMSPLRRQKVKEWMTGTMAHRVQPGGAVILIMSRWHEDDLAGFLLREAPDRWAELRLPAVADDPADPLGREVGEPLWPEEWPLAALEERHQDVSLELGESIWLAQYQQTPRTPEGGMFPQGMWRYVDDLALQERPTRWVRAWDLAATEGGGDWTVGVRMGRLPDGRFVIADVRRGRWGADQVRFELRRAANDDPPGTRIEFPQDPGQAGKDQSQQITRMLAGFDVHSRPVSGSKEVRAAGFAAQQQAGNFLLLPGDWHGPFIAELGAFPKGQTDDQVDAAADAFNALVGSVTTGRSVQDRSSVLRGTR